MPAPEPKQPLLWPAVAAVGVADAFAAFVVVLALSVSDRVEPEPGPLEPLTILVAVPVDDTVVRVVTQEGGCRLPVFADVRVRADALELRVIGQDPGGGCTADFKIRCNRVRLPATSVRKPLVAGPLAERADRVSYKALARQYATSACPPLRLRYGAQTALRPTSFTYAASNWDQPVLACTGLFIS
jgi:hypothetical protein